MNGKRLISALACWVALLAGLAQAEVQTLAATHTYILGDNDSRNDARQLCFLEAKRKVLEKAGSYIQSQSKVENFKLTKDQITSYSAAVLSVEIIKEDYSYSNGHNSMTLTVKANVDMADVRRRLQAISEDRGLQERISVQQDQIRQLETQVRQLNERVNTAPASTAGELRKERNLVFDNLRELEDKKLVALQRIADEKERVRSNSDNILKYIIKGMTQAEVEGILGKPVKVQHQDVQGGAPNWFYGELWVCFYEPLGAGDYRVQGIGELKSLNGRWFGCSRDAPPR